MARPREFDIDQALDAAMGAFWARGYEATSMADLMEVMELQKGSIYKAFEDKHTLFLKTLERYLDQMDQGVRQTLEEAASPSEAIRAWIGTGVKMCCGQGTMRGCLGLNTAVELGPHDGEVAALLKGHYERTIALLAATIERGQVQGEFRDDLPAGQLANSLMVFGAGLMVTSKGLGGQELDLGQMEEVWLGMLGCC